jgi:hypothetical protein
MFPSMKALSCVSSKRGGLGLDVGVEPLDQHGEAQQLLQLDVILGLHDAVQAGVRGPQNTGSELLFLPQKVEKQGEGILSRGSQLKIMFRDKITKLRPNPLVLFLTLFKLQENILVSNNGQGVSRAPSPPWPT